MKRDRARTKILRTSPFGLIEMTRQRIRPSLKRSVYQDCPCCTGTGVVKTAESMAIEVVRMLMFAAHREGVVRVSVTVHEEVANYLHNKKRREIARLEDEGQMDIQVFGKEEAAPEHLVVDCFDSTGREIKLPAPGAGQPGGHSGREKPEHHGS